MGRSEEWFKIAMTPATDAEIELHKRVGVGCVGGCVACIDRLQLVARIEADRNAARTLTYLACPYSHPEHDVRHARFVAANVAAGALMSQGALVFSPISHTHPIAEQCDMPKGWDFWERFDRAYLAASKRLVVLTLDGWRESVGVQAEIAIAAEMGIPVEYLDPI